MKFVSLMLLLVASNVMADIPNLPEQDLELAKLQKKTVKVVYNLADSSKGSSSVDSGVHSTDVYLPAKSVVVRSWLYVDTAVTNDATAGATKLAFHCEDAANIMAATSINQPAGNVVEGAATGASTAYATGIAAVCNIKGTVTGSSASAGKVLLFVDYVVAQ